EDIQDAAMVLAGPGRAGAGAGGGGPDFAGDGANRRTCRPGLPGALRAHRQPGGEQCGGPLVVLGADAGRGSPAPVDPGSGQAATAGLARNGVVGTNTTHTDDTQTVFVAYNDVYGHNIPRAFWDFMNAPGQALINGQNTLIHPLTNWIFTIGYPVTEPYWAV